MFTKTIPYEAKDVVAQGHVAYDDTMDTKRPAVIVCHDWTGRNEFACKKAEQLASMGYVGFALDMYGEAKQGQDNDEKMKFMSPLVENRQLLRDRVTAAFETVKAMDVVDEDNIAIIGFCFGGLCALDLARSGAEITGAVSFHGLLNSPVDIPNQSIKAKVLVLHGHDDPMVPPEQVLQFEKEMTDAKVDWQVHVYGKTAHAFTNPQANDSNLGTIYNETAASRAWLSMTNFLHELKHTD